MTSGFGQFSRGSRRLVLPVLSACFFHVGFWGLIQGAGNLLQTGIVETINFVIRRGFHDIIEISVQRWPWRYYATVLPAGLLFLALGLATAYWAARRRRRKNQQKEALA